MALLALAFFPNNIFLRAGRILALAKASARGGVAARRGKLPWRIRSTSSPDRRLGGFEISSCEG